jgi:hypothetical protein
VRENDASADQQQIQHDRGDAARHSQAEDDDAAEPGPFSFRFRLNDQRWTTTRAPTFTRL